MRRERKHIRMEEKLASALYEIELWKSHAHSFNDFETLRALRKANAPASAVCKRFHWDHAVFHVDAGPDTWVNLTPLPIGEHKEKTKKDLGVIAKGKRIRKKQAAHDIKAAKGNAEVLGHLTRFIDTAKDAKMNVDGVHAFDAGEPPSLAGLGYDGKGKRVFFMPLITGAFWLHKKKRAAKKRAIPSRPFPKTRSRLRGKKRSGR